MSSKVSGSDLTKPYSSSISIATSNESNNQVRPQNLKSSQTSLFRLNENLPKCETCMPTLTDIATRYVKNLDEFRVLKQNQIIFAFTQI